MAATTNGCSCVFECICAYYAMDEGPNTEAFDSTENEFNLTPNGTPLPDAIRGKIQNARTFDGATQYFTHSSEDCFSIQQGYTIWGWFNASSIFTLKILAAKSPSSVVAEWSISVTTGPAGSVSLNVLATDASIISATVAPGEGIAEGEFHFVAAWVDTAAEKIYVRFNGTTSPGTSYSGKILEPPDASIDFSMGASSIGIELFDGKLDEWGIANKMLSTIELNCLYNDGEGVNFEDASNCITCPQNLCECIVEDVDCEGEICAFFRLDEANGGNAIDATTNNDCESCDSCNLTGPVGGASSVDGLVNRARSVVGTTGFTSITNKECFCLRDGTIWGWWNLQDEDDAPPEDWVHPIATGSDWLISAAGTGFDEEPNPGILTISFSVDSGAAEVSITTDDIALPIKTFIFIAASIDETNGTFSLTVNEEVRSGTLPALPACSASSLALSGGVLHTDATTFLDEWGVVTRVLTSDELRCIHNMGQGANYEGASSCTGSPYNICVTANTITDCDDAEVDDCCDCESMCDCECDICAYYKLDETDATDVAEDSTGNTFGLVPNNDPGLEASDTVINGSRTFDGTNQSFFNLHKECFSIQQSHTIWGWFRIDGKASSASGYHVLAAKSNSTASISGVDEWVIRANEQLGKIEFIVGLDPASDFSVEISSPIRTGIWYFFAAWANPNTKQAFLRFNGDIRDEGCEGNTQEATETASSDFAGPDIVVAFALGAWSNFVDTSLASHLKGSLDELGFASAILSKSQLNAIYNNGKGMSFDEIISKVICCDEETGNTSIGQLIFGQECFQQFLQDCCGVDCCQPVNCCDAANRLSFCNQVCAFYALNEGADTDATDESHNVFNLTKHGSPGPGSIQDGEICEARTFNGVDQYFTHPHDDCFSIQKGHTIWGWFRTSNASQSAILAAKSGSSTMGEWFLRIDISTPTSVTITFEIINSVGPNNIVSGTVPFTLGEWNFVEATFDPFTQAGGSPMHLKINGTIFRVNFFPFGKSPDPSVDFSLAAFNDGGDPFDGDLDEWGVIERQLIIFNSFTMITTEEFDLFSNPGTCCRTSNCCLTANRSVICDEICAFYALNEDTDEDAIDASLNSFDLTKHGLPGPGSALGRICDARTFNGVDQYFTHPHDDCFSIQQGYSIWGWFKTSNASQSAILAAKSDSGILDEWSLRIDTATSTFTFDIGFSSLSVTSSSFTLGKWNFVAAWIRPSPATMFLQVNLGLLGKFITSVHLPDPSVDFSLAAFNDGGAPFDGDLDEWGIIKRNLSFTEATDLFTDPITCCNPEEEEEAAPTPLLSCLECCGSGTLFDELAVTIPAGWTNNRCDGCTDISGTFILDSFVGSMLLNPGGNVTPTNCTGLICAQWRFESTSPICSVSPGTGCPSPGTEVFIVIEATLSCRAFTDACTWNVIVIPQFSSDECSAGFCRYQLIHIRDGRDCSASQVLPRIFAGLGGGIICTDCSTTVSISGP